jgi:beta-mannosidase
VALYRDGAQLVEEASTPISVGGHGAWRGNVEGVLGHFVDVSWAYRFGPAAQDLIVVSLQRDDELLSQAFRFPLGRPSGVRALAEVGLSARLSRLAGGRLAVTVRSDRYAHGVRIRVPGWRPSDDGFGVEPGHPRTVVLALASDAPPSATPTGVVTALNVAGTVALERDW